VKGEAVPEGIGTVVVGCDGTPDTDPALRFAADEAQLRHADLVVVVAYYRPIDPDVDDFDTPRPVLQQQARDRTETCLRRALHGSGGELPGYQIIAGEGDPAQLLLDNASGAALVVIGAHQRSFLQRMFSQPTSRHLLRDAEVPVVIVPGRAAVDSGH